MTDLIHILLNIITLTNFVIVIMLQCYMDNPHFSLSIFILNILFDLVETWYQTKIKTFTEIPSLSLSLYLFSFILSPSSIMFWWHFISWRNQSVEKVLLFKVVDLFFLYQHWPGSFYLMGHLQQLAQILSDPEN